MSKKWVGAGLAVLACGTAMAQDSPICFSKQRLEIYAVMETLNAELLASRSATFTLEKWCREHNQADPPQILAQLATEVDKQPSRETRERLQVAEGEVVKYRRVDLTCGDKVLSRADNWYVPSRLTTEMNQTLETSGTPFGKAVADLKPSRQTLSAKLLWEPLPRGWEMHLAEMPACGQKLTAENVPDGLFEHRAVLTRSDRAPFSEVVETYQRDVLAFAQGPLAP